LRGAPALILCTYMFATMPTPLPPTPPLKLPRYLVEDEYGQVWTGGSTYADLPIHMHMANSFLYGRNRVVFFNGMHSPVFAGEVRRCPVPRCLCAVLRCLWAACMLSVGCLWAACRLLCAACGLPVGCLYAVCRLLCAAYGLPVDCL
jgi:hypothetical protein